MNAGCAGKTVTSLENACHTWAPWRCVHDEALYKFTFTFTCDLDLDPMTLMCEFDRQIVKMYLHAANELLEMSVLSKVRASQFTVWQRCDRTYCHAAFVDGKNSRAQNPKILILLEISNIWSDCYLKYHIHVYVPFWIYSIIHITSHTLFCLIIKLTLYTFDIGLFAFLTT